MDLLATLDTLLAFVTLVLLLSLVVTTLVQATQSLLRLRGRTLRVGLSRLFETLGIAQAARAFDLADQVLQRRVLLPERGKLAAHLKGSATTVIREEEVRDILSEISDQPEPATGEEEARDMLSEIPGQPEPATETVGEDFSARFSRMEDFTRLRFQRQVRVITVAWALLVAVLFQASAPQLLRDLSTDAKLRASIIEAIPEITATADKTFRVPSYEDVSVQALEQLQVRYPELQPQLEEVGGVGEDRAFLVKELQLVLADVPDGARVAEEYDALLQKLRDERLNSALDGAQAAVAELARLNVGLWPGGWQFYYSNGLPMTDNCVGVLIMAILISLGAPFWYERLMDLAGLRDALTRRARPSKDESQSAKT